MYQITACIQALSFYDLEREPQPKRHLVRIANQGLRVVWIGLEAQEDVLREVERVFDSV